MPQKSAAFDSSTPFCISHVAAVFRLLTDQASAALVAAAEQAAASASTAQAAAQGAIAAAAGLNLPEIQPGDAGKQLYVKPEEDGYELRPPGDAEIADRAALKALNTTAFTRVRFDGTDWYFRNGDYSAEVTADPLEGFYVPPASDPTGASGCWVREDGQAVQGYRLDRFPGGLADRDGSDGGTDVHAVIEAALDMVAALGPGRTVLMPLSGTEKYLWRDSVSVPSYTTLRLFPGVQVSNDGIGSFANLVFFEGTVEAEKNLTGRPGAWRQES